MQDQSIIKLRTVLHWGYEQALLPPLARKIRRTGLTYLSPSKLRSLHQEILRVQKQNIDGDMMEFGIALGGSAILMAKTADNRSFHGFDVFGMIPPPSEEDGSDSHSRYEDIRNGRAKGLGGDEYYGYMDDLYSCVSDNFTAFDIPPGNGRVHLHKGLFQDTVCLTRNDRVALAHVDCDWYEPVMHCLVNISQALVSGGTMIFDDYNDFEGCRRAVDDGLKNDPSLSIIRTRPHAVVRKL